MKAKGSRYTVHITFAARYAQHTDLHVELIDIGGLV
jgi:hypothetical protein